ncbi:MAG: bifunctional diguanylate cyclase/phosphodiesterase [Chloroflexota bacterium]
MTVRDLSDPRNRWLVTAIVLGGMAVVGAVLPRPLPGDLLLIPSLLLGAVVLAQAVRDPRLASRRAWVSLTVGVLILVPGLVAVGLGAMTVMDIANSPARVIGYIALALGCLGLIREDDPNANRDIVIDALILSTAAAMISWYGLIQPRLAAGLVDDWAGAVLALAYPAADSAVLVLAALALWRQKALAPYQWLVALALICNTATDVGLFHGYTFVGHQAGQPTDLGLLLVVPLLAAAVLHPSARVAYGIRPRLRGPSSLGIRIVVVASSLLIAPAILIMWAVAELQTVHDAVAPPGAPSIEIQIAIGMLVLAALVSVRLLGALAGVAHVIRIRDELEGELNRQAHSDVLTQLPNRIAFGAQLDLALARQQPPVAVLFCDLDDFRTVNDTLGHSAGDELLVAAADRLRHAVRPGDLAARLGGDEFAVLVADVDPAARADDVAQRIQQAMGEPFEVGGATVAVNVSIGIATSADGATAADLMQDADIAMYLAKGDGKARARHFAHGMRAEVAERVAFQADLADAIERDALRLVYQPIVSLDARATVGAEALLRWDHPKRGVVPPLVFVPLAEQTGLIVPLGRWVLATACRQMRSWLDHGAAADAQISVNVSPVQLVHPGFVGDIRAVLGETGLAPANLMLEITESALVDPDQAGLVLFELRELGVRIAVDDFGTGYSAMSYLATFPIDVLKIDRSFIEAMGADQQGPALVTTIVHLARNLQLDTIAEGIEEEAQLRSLVAMGCRFGQGYLLGRPMDAEVVGAMLAHTPGSRPRRARTRARALKAGTTA